MFGRLLLFCFAHDGLASGGILRFSEGMKPDYEFERAAQARGFSRIAGVDEVGRGPLAGPVTAAAVVLNANDIPDGLNDSKQLSAKVRQRLNAQLHEVADIGIGHATVAEIEEHNILRASHIAMTRALENLENPADFALIDGNMVPRGLNLPAQTVVKGDTRVMSIAAASIVAKICRDCVMLSLAQQHPGYGWETNMGYGTKSHMEALQNLGVTPHHRRLFKPVHKML